MCKRMNFSVLLLFVIVLLIQEGSCTTFSLNIGEHQRQVIQPLQNYTIRVNAQAAWGDNYAAFTVQVHTQRFNLTLRNASRDCNITRLCTAVGTSTGLVEILLSEGVFTYEASIRNCGGSVAGNSSSNCAGVNNVSILIAVVGVQNMDPIPGGCAQTSALEYEAAITPYYSSQSTKVYFQGSDVGFQPMVGQPIPACDTNERVISHLEYHVYRQCVSYDDFGEELLFGALDDMLNPLTSDKVLLSGKLKYSDPKRVLFDSYTGHGIVYNVVVKDTTLGTMSSYIPVSTYSCDFLADGCKLVTPWRTYILGLLLGASGLFLCFLAHRLFHVEVFIFSSMIGYFLSYLTLSATTQWTTEAIAWSSLGLAVAFSLLLFLLWFFTGYYYIFVIFFGLSMGSLVSATILFTPVGSLISLLELNYVYILGFLCVAVVCIVPLVAFPVMLNIVASSLVGSYAVIFCISLFKYTQLQDILMRIIKNASIDGFLSAHTGCGFQTIDIALTCLWILLNFTGLAVQLTIYLIQKRRHKKQQQQILARAGDPFVNHSYIHRYLGFPSPSLYRRLVKKRTAKRLYRPVTTGRVRSRVVSNKVRTGEDSSRPLLSPNSHDQSPHSHSNTHVQYYGAT